MLDRMSFTKKQLRRLKDKSPAGSPMRWVMTRDALGSEQVGVSRFEFEPGARMPWGHRHREQEEVYLVVAGGGRFKLDEELVEVTAGDVVRVDPQTWRAYEAGPDGLDIICVGGARPPGGDTEKDHGFWN
jgi:quercetin dioxygenase-like cupin family protein